MKDMYPNPTQEMQSVKSLFLKIEGERRGEGWMFCQRMKKMIDKRPKRSIAITLGDFQPSWEP